MNSKKLSVFGASLAAIAAATSLNAAPAFAQDEENGGLEEIVVTAQRREESLQDVPLAITAFTEEDLERSAAVGIQDVAARAPGVTLTQFNIGEPQLYIRGVGTTSDSAASDPSIGISIDESMKVIVGPRIAYSMWSADYSDKPQSATQSVYVHMQDAGIGVHAEFDDMWLQFGTGTSEITSGMMVGGNDIQYGFSGDQYTYYNVGLGYKSGIFSLGIGFTSYTDYAQYCDHMSFILGLSI